MWSYFFFESRYKFDPEFSLKYVLCYKLNQKKTEKRSAFAMLGSVRLIPSVTSRCSLSIDCNSASHNLDSGSFAVCTSQHGSAPQQINQQQKPALGIEWITHNTAYWGHTPYGAGETWRITHGGRGSDGLSVGSYISQRYRPFSRWAGLALEFIAHWHKNRFIMFWHTSRWFGLYLKVNLVFQLEFETQWDPQKNELGSRKLGGEEKIPRRVGGGKTCLFWFRWLFDARLCRNGPSSATTMNTQTITSTDQIMGGVSGHLFVIIRKASVPL